MKKVVIVGGGFAGLSAARHLARKASLEVILIDQRNHHLFQPLLYQVATAGLNPADIAAPIRAQFSGVPNICVYMKRISGVRLGERQLTCEDGSLISYDYLVLACGTKHSYFDHPEWEEFAPGLKTIEQATEIRRRILSAFERAEDESDPDVQRSLLTFVIVGGGPTGVELAGAIADISRSVLVRDFRRINSASARVVLLEAGDRVLASFPASLSERARQDLGLLGVEVRTAARVVLINQDGVSIGGGEIISAKNVFWGAGVQAEKLGATLGVTLDKAGRIAVNPDLSVPSYQEVFVIGDMALVAIDDKTSVPGLAPAAVQMGKCAAENILALAGGRPTKSFYYWNKGQMATIGRRKAVAQLGKVHLIGYTAWMAWTFIHIFSLIGFKNRLVVFLEWTWSYLFSKRGARLITTRNWREEGPGKV